MNGISYNTGEPIEVGDVVTLAGIGTGTVTIIIPPLSDEARMFNCYPAGGVMLEGREIGGPLLLTADYDDLSLVRRRDVHR